jgi:hypothetical protein
MTTTTSGAPSKPITAPKPPKPPTIPWPKPRAIHDARRSRLDRELDAAIERVRPAMERAHHYYTALGIDPAAMACSAKALSLWNGNAAAVANITRSVIF